MARGRPIKRSKADELVLDSSMAVAWTFEDETNDDADHGLTVYDAAYLELAIRRGLPLATVDAQLRAAAKSAGVKRL